MSRDARRARAGRDRLAHDRPNIPPILRSDRPRGRVGAPGIARQHTWRRRRNWRACGAAARAING